MNDPATPIGAFEVHATPDEVAAFRAATGAIGGHTDVLPFTFPMRWLVTPDVRTAVAGMVSDPDLIFVHEAQTFEYIGPLRVGEIYRLELTGTRQHAPERLVVRGMIADRGGAVRASLETILRLFSTKAVAA